jgi:hypothetical protein
MPVKSSPTMAATRDAALLDDGTTLSQHCGEVGGVTGGVVVGMAAARVCRKFST